MTLPKDVSNNFTKAMFSLKRYNKNCVRSIKTVIPTQSVTFMEIFTTRIASLTNQLIGKGWSGESLTVLGYDDLKSLK